MHAVVSGQVKLHYAAPYFKLITQSFFHCYDVTDKARLFWNPVYLICADLAFSFYNPLISSYTKWKFKQDLGIDEW